MKNIPEFQKSIIKYGNLLGYKKYEFTNLEKYFEFHNNHELEKWLRKFSWIWKFSQISKNLYEIQNCSLISENVHVFRKKLYFQNCSKFEKKNLNFQNIPRFKNMNLQYVLGFQKMLSNFKKSSHIWKMIPRFHKIFMFKKLFLKLKMTKEKKRKTRRKEKNGLGRVLEHSENRWGGNKEWADHRLLWLHGLLGWPRAVYSHPHSLTASLPKMWGFRSSRDLAGLSCLSRSRQGFLRPRVLQMTVNTKGTQHDYKSRYYWPLITD